MKKKILTLLGGMFLLTSQLSYAAASKAGGLELSGNVDVVSGWQHDDNKALGVPIGGQLGTLRNTATAPGHDTFNFYIDQVELDLNKSFGENIRIRADLDFGRVLSGSARTTDSGGTGSGFELEQGYVTLNIPIGNGIEMLVGRFNAPIGYYVLDRGDNPTISFPAVFNYLTPGNVTGAKFFYAFGDHFDWHLYVVNNLSDGVAFGNGAAARPAGLAVDTAIPSYGTRFGFNWGSEDAKSTVGLSYAGGPERVGCGGAAVGCKKHLTHIADLDWAVKFGSQILFAGELAYRQDNAITAGTTNDKAWSGFALVNYDFNETWRVFLRYGFMQDRTGFYTAVNQNMHDAAVGVGYQITDGAKLKMEYSPTIFDPRTAGISTSWSHGFALEFAYNF